MAHWHEPGQLRSSRESVREKATDLPVRRIGVYEGVFVDQMLKKCAKTGQEQAITGKIAHFFNMDTFCVESLW